MTREAKEAPDAFLRRAPRIVVTWQAATSAHRTYGQAKSSLEPRSTKSGTPGCLTTGSPLSSTVIAYVPVDRQVTR